MGVRSLLAFSIAVYLVSVALIFRDAPDVKITTLHIIASIFWVGAAVVNAISQARSK